MPSTRSVGEVTEPRKIRSLPTAVASLKHLPQIAADRHFLNRIGQLTILEIHNSGSAALEGPGNQIGAKAQQAGARKIHSISGNHLFSHVSQRPACR